VLVDLGDWSGLIKDRNDDFDSIWVVAPQPAVGGYSGAFRVTASDKRDYFVKSLQTCPADQQASVAVERIVALLGSLIGAPVCEISLIRVTADLVGWEPRPGCRLQEGLAHASVALNHAEEQRTTLAARSNNDNRRRHVGVYALHDWCFGTDLQWLHDLDNERMMFSHDHGLYFPPEGRGGWTRQDLITQLDQAHELPDARADLSPEAIEEVAVALESVNRASLLEVLTSIPASWPVSNQDLEDLGWFLEHRAPAVAHRVRKLV
jgi:hypothetical protein